MLTKTIDVKTPQATLSELLSLIQAGDEVLLVDGTTPLARLVPVEPPKQPRILGLHAHLGTAWMSEDFDEPLPDEFWLDEE